MSNLRPLGVDLTSGQTKFSGSTDTLVLSSAVVSPNFQTLSGDISLAQSDSTYQYLDPNSANRTVTLPAAPLTGTTYIIINTQTTPANSSTTAYYLTVRDSSAVWLGSVFPGEQFTFSWNGGAWTGNGVFTIGNISGILAWYDASSQTYSDTGFTTPATANDTAVAGWRDISGSGSNWDFTQSTIGQRPILKTNVVNSLPVLRFTTAASSVLSTAVSGQALVGPVTVFCVHARAWTVASYGILLDCGAGTSAGGFELFTTGSAANGWATKSIVVCGQGTTINQARAYGPYGGVADNTWHIIATVIGPKTSIDFDGTQIDTARFGGYVGGVSGTVNLRIGLDSSANKLDGDIAAIGIVAGDMGLYGRRRAQQYLGARYAITV